MQDQRTDKLVTVLTVLTSFAYFGLLIGTAVTLIVSLLLKVFAGNTPVSPGEWDSTFTWAVEVTPSTRGPQEQVLTRWGPAQVDIVDPRAKLHLPLRMLPWPIFALLWTQMGIAMGLMILFLRNLRRIFQRVRDGAPFDADNAIRLRSLGVLVIVLALFNWFATFSSSWLVSKGLESDRFSVPVTFSFNTGIVFFALVLIALAEIFRRGAELETEQSLVV